MNNKISVDDVHKQQAAYKAREWADERGVVHHPLATNPDKVDASEKLYTLEEDAMAKYYYKAQEVDEATYDAVDIGGQFEGGTVLDGLCDKDRNVLLLVTRHGDEEGSFGYEHPEGKPFFLKKGVN